MGFGKYMRGFQVAGGVAWELTKACFDKDENINPAYVLFTPPLFLVVLAGSAVSDHYSRKKWGSVD